MTVKEVYEKLVPVLADSLGIDEEKVTMDADLRADLGADSLDSVEAIMAVEEEFGIEIPEEEAEKFAIVREIVEYLAKNIE